MSWFRDRHGDEPERDTYGIFSLGGSAGRSPGRGKMRGFTRWGRSSGGTGRDRPPSERTRRQSGRGRPR